MKKSLIIMSILMAALLTGCGAKQNQSSTAINKEYTIENEKETTSNGTENTSKPQKADSSDTTKNVTDDKFAYKIHDNCMDIDSDKGPYYIIDMNTMKVIDCTSTGAKVVDYKKDGNTLTITLYSDEYPVNATYVIDMRESTTDKVTKQSIENNVLKFSTEKGPDYEINLDTQKLVSCSDKTGRIVKFTKDGKTLTLILYSDTLPVDMTYTFNIN